MSEDNPRPCGKPFAAEQAIPVRAVRTGSEPALGVGVAVGEVGPAVVGVGGSRKTTHPPASSKKPTVLLVPSLTPKIVRPSGCSGTAHCRRRGRRRPPTVHTRRSAGNSACPVPRDGLGRRGLPEPRWFGGCGRSVPHAAVREVLVRHPVPPDGRSCNPGRRYGAEGKGTSLIGPLEPGVRDAGGRGDAGRRDHRRRRAPQVADGSAVKFELHQPVPAPPARCTA